MPGTIQVSVLDLMDLPSTSSPATCEASTDLFYLKVAMGKTEYQTAGKGDFSFPVVSLRDNLIVMLHDAGGNEISRAEFKTMSVVEKGFWDDVFPLVGVGGGRVRMKLEFSLSAEERKRIREMREFALKLKQEELLKGGHKTSNSGECQNPSGNPSLQELQQLSEHSSEQDVSYLAEVDKETLTTQSAYDTSQRDLPMAEGVDSQVTCSRSIIPKNITKDRCSTSADLSEKIKSPRRLVLSETNFKSNVKQMISTFEGGLSQGIEARLQSRTKSHLNKIEMEGFKSACSEVSDVKEKKIPLTMSRSFSAGRLSEFNSDQNPNSSKSIFVKQEGAQHVDHATRWNTMGKKDQASNFNGNQNSKNLDFCKQKAVMVDKYSYDGSLNVAQPQMTKEKNIGPIETEAAVRYESSEHKSGRKSPVFVEVKENPSSVSIHRDCSVLQQKIDLDCFPKEVHSLDEQHSLRNPGSMPSSHNGKGHEFLGGKHNLTDTSAGREDDGNESLKVVHDNKSKEKCSILEETHVLRTLLGEPVNINRPCTLCTHEHGFMLDADSKESGSRSYGSLSGERTNSGTSNVMMDLLSCDNAIWIFESLNTWIPRHICITTGSRQVRDLFENCNIYLQADPMQQNLCTMGDNENQMQGNTSIEVKEDRKMFHSSESSNLRKPMGISKLSGGLIEQGVRIFIIIVACGTLLLSTRQRNPR